MQTVTTSEHLATYDASRPLWRRVAIAILLVAIATLVSVVLSDLVGRAMLVVYVAAVGGAAWYGGLRVGLFAALLSIVAYETLVLGPPLSLTIGTVDDVLALAVLSITATLFSTLNRSMRQSLRHAEAAEQRVSDILGSIADPMVVHDAKWRFRFLNHQAQEALAAGGDVDPSELIGKVVWDAYPQLIGTPVEQAMRKAAREGVPSRFEAYYAPRDRWSELTFYPTSDGGLVTSWRDITERRHAAEVSGRLAALVESSDDAIVGKSLEGIVTSWNAGAERIFGYTAEEMIGQPILRLMPLDRQHEETEILRRIRAGQRIEHFESIRRRKDGTLIDVSVTISPVLDAQGKVVSASKIARDVTRQKRESDANRFLTEASALLGSSLDANQTLAQLVKLAVPRLADWCSVHVLDESGVASSIGEATSPALDDVTRQALQERNTLHTLTQGVNQVLRSGHSELASSVESLSTPAPLPAPLAHASLMTVPLVARARVLGALTLMWLHGRRYTEQDLSFAEELGRRAGMAIDNARLYRAEQEARAEAERARQEAETANQAKTDFLATMSHELRTPLNAIGGYAELLEMGVRGNLTSDQREDLRRIQRSQRHLLALINDVLNFARIDGGHIDLRMTSVPLHQALAGMEALIAPQIARKSQRYEYSGVDPSVSALADRDKLTQIVLNLLSNAMKFTPEGGSIRVDADYDDETVIIRVSDTGVGIPADKCEAIFDPFVQVERSLTRTVEGTGLGLAISRDLVRAMGGDISVQSTVGKGSVFTVTLPRADVTAHAGAPAHTAPQPAHSAHEPA